MILSPAAAELLANVIPARGGLPKNARPSTGQAKPMMDFEIALCAASSKQSRRWQIGKYASFFIPDHETLAKGDYVRIGFNDTFGSLHWAPKRHIHDALPKIRQTCERAGKNWRNAA